MKRRVISLMLTASLCFGLFVFSAPVASASYVYDPQPPAGADFIHCLTDVIFAAGGVEFDSSKYNFTFNKHGFVTERELEAEAEHYNSYLGSLIRFAGSPVGFKNPFTFAVKAYDSDNGIWRLADSATGKWIVDNAGRFPYFEAVVAGEDKGAQELSTDANPAPELNKLYGNQWISRETAEKNLLNINPAYSYDELQAHANTLNLVNRSKDVSYAVRSFGKDSPYYGLTRSIESTYGSSLTTWLADKYGNPYLTTKQKFELAINQKVNNIVQDGNGNAVVIQGETVTTEKPVIDQSKMELNIPIHTGSDVSIDEYVNQKIYDMTFNADNRSYTVNTYDVTYNNDNRRYETKYYTWNITYNVSNTYVTNIGSNDAYQQEEYEFYYELPDGRSSADLTADEVAALSFQFYDVLNYERSATDGNIKALFHFDGDLSDSSYFSDQTKFEWQKGASITYMDSSTFNGALYLDETQHDFVITLPSSISVDDEFTIQFRYYQSSVPDTQPNVDNSVSLDGNTLIRWDERSLYLGGNSEPSCTLPIGNWCEFAFRRGIYGGYISPSYRVFVNGVSVGDVNMPSLSGNELRFSLGPDSRAYSMLDELRVVDFNLLGGGSSYTPTAVPYDSNLVLVLPGEGNMVSDYLEIRDPSNKVAYPDFRDVDYLDYVESDNPGEVPSWQWQFNDRRGAQISAVDGYLTLGRPWASSGFEPRIYETDPTIYGFYILLSRTYLSGGVLHTESAPGYTPGRTLFGCILGAPSAKSWGDDYQEDVWYKAYGVNGAAFRINTTSSCDFEYPWGRIVYKRVYNALGEGQEAIFLVPNGPSSVDLLYFGLQLQSSSSHTGYRDYTFTRHYGSLDGTSLKSNTAAVQTDIPITGYTVGGVRPTFPVRGNVWFAVTNGRISSVQIYTGSAWTSVNARWWTGSRWIPIYAFDIFTLEDCWDIADKDDVTTPITTETEGWNWWKGAWKNFRSWLKEQFGGGSAPGPDDLVPSSPVTTTFTLYGYDQDHCQAIQDQFDYWFDRGYEVSPTFQIDDYAPWGRDFSPKMGTSDYFTVHYSQQSKIDQMARGETWGLPYGIPSGSTRFNLGGSIGNKQMGQFHNSIEFTTANPSQVRVWWGASGSGTVQLLDRCWVQLQFFDADWSDGRPVQISTFDLSSAGTYYLGSDNCSIYIHKVEVVEYGHHDMGPVDIRPETNSVMTSHTLLSSRQVTNSTLAALAQTADLSKKGWGDGLAVKMGTGNYFTVHYSGKSKVDRSDARTWKDGFSTTDDTPRFNLGGGITTNNGQSLSQAVEFTTTGSAVVKVWWVAAEDDRYPTITDLHRNQFASGQAEYLRGGDPCISTMVLEDPGTWLLGGYGYNLYIFKVEVTERIAVAPTVAIGYNPGDNYDDGEPDILDDPLQDEDGEDVSVFGLFGWLGKSLWQFTKGLFGSVLGGVTGFFGSVSDGMGDFFGGFNSGGIDLGLGPFGFYNYGGLDIWD